MKRMPSLALPVGCAALLLLFGVSQLEAQAPATPPPVQAPAQATVQAPARRLQLGEDAAEHGT